MILVRNESFKEFLSKYPITSAIVFLNTIAFLYTSLLGALSGEGIFNRWGGISLEYIQQNEYYRFFSYAFLHGSFAHFAFNMAAIIIINPPIEKSLGKLKYAVLFFFTILGSAIAILIMSNHAVVGASGFGYGVFGVYLSIICFKKKLIDRQSRTALLVFITIGWLITLFAKGVSFAGHFGGFISGFVLGIVFLWTNSFKEMK
ncbi:rhomboid family intramembrane serine protease [Virgibacillus sp. 179-BFC.A HS]|uniref:Rhomboid family intramembrane serine protease n=1 Tax=Tigheibacillus jepli TaxID=3035914 RepID=A0ABU5CLY2_9BACI|nr:rhomboid family intramembrane serine protease [Virgibacillus sp. 179-BFC.A HS]MDY0406799.1 rhomboid family intramembrane serine protease [Virgibacillus sp. 179-BFC.A HS]